MLKIYPSLLAHDREAWPSIITAQPWAGVHCDMMDGEFVSTQGLSKADLEHIDALTQWPLWVHCMVKDPGFYANLVAMIPGITRVSLHYESATKNELYDIFMFLRECGIQISLALNPATSVDVVDDFVRVIDHVLVMSVEPGKSGQEFLPATWDKLKQLQELCARHVRPLEIAVDGGVRKEHCEKLEALGVTECAVGIGIKDFLV